MSSEIQPPMRSWRAAAPPLVAAAGGLRQDPGRRLVDGVADVADEDLRVERLAGQGRRAHLAAAAALGAGVAVEHLLPGQVLDARGAEPLGVLEVDLDQPSHRLEVHEEDVGDRREDVEVLRVRQVVGEEEQVREVEPPAPLVDRLQRRRGPARQRAGDRSDHGSPGRRVLRGESGPRPLGEQIRRHQEGDQKEDQPRVPGQIQAFRPREGPPKDGQRHAGEREDLEDVLDQGVGVAGRPGEEHEARDQPLDHEGEGAHRENDEAAEDQDVEKARVEVAEHPALREGVLERLHDARPDLREPVVPPPRHEDPDPPRHRIDEDRDGEKHEEPEDGPARETEDQSFGRKRRHWRES